jgi:hypothetical protein
MIGYAALVTFIAVWVGTGVFARKHSQSMTIAIGGGFLASTVITGAAFSVIGWLVSSHPAVSTKVFDPSVPENERIALVKEFIVGDWYEPPTDPTIAATHHNYTFGSDGSLKIWTCNSWGEASERKYKFNGDKGLRKYSIGAARYANSGKIHYQVIRGDGIWQYPLLIIDRDKGFVTFFPALNSGKPIKRGHSTDCPE